MNNLLTISITSDMMDDANAYVLTLSPADTQPTFVINTVDNSSNQYCTITLPDNGNDFTNAMTAQYADYLNNTSLVSAFSQGGFMQSLSSMFRGNQSSVTELMYYDDGQD